MADYNRVIMIGNLTRDPELKTLQSGQPLCRMSIASNRQFKNRQTGAMVQEVCFIDVDVWGNQAESCRQYLQKGRPVLIEGRLKFDTWQDSNGGGTRSKHTVVADRVVFLGSGAQAGMSDGDMAGEMNDDDSGPRQPGSQLERELLDQIGQIKNRAAKKDKEMSSGANDNDDMQMHAASRSDKRAPARKATRGGHEEASSGFDGQGSGVKFQDEPPFEDELPF